MNHNGLRIMAAIVAAAISSLAAVGVEPASAPAVWLDQPYLDLKNGFSLHPPAFADRQRQPSPHQLVSWASRDAKTGAIEWTLTVLKAVEIKEIKDVKAFSGQVLDRLKDSGGFAHEGMSLCEIDKKESFDIRGTATVGKNKVWQRQVWVQQAPSVFLVVMISGPTDLKDRLDSVLAAVLKTFKIIDLKAVAAQREENLKTGKALLAGLTNDKLVASPVKEPKWFVLRFKGKDVGFMGQYEMPQTIGERKGIAVRNVALFVSGKEKRTLKRSVFVTGDMAYEEWSEEVGVTGVTKSDTEKGTRQGEQITTALTPSEGAAVTRTAKAPKDTNLPRAVGMLLPRLVDLTKPASYAFLSYNAQGDVFDTRTFTVEGNDKVRVGDKTIDCVRVSDQVSVTAEPATFYFDAKGDLIRMTAAEMTEDAASADEVAKLFSEAKAFDSFLRGGNN